MTDDEYPLAAKDEVIDAGRDHNEDDYDERRRGDEGVPHDEWVPVSSSNVAEVLYASLSAHLHVRFHSGHSGYYAGVPESVFAEMLNAPSKGVFVHRVLKPGYAWVRD